MRSTFGGIEISKRALFTQQAALSTTGHNIANANTAGYSRQVVNMVAAKPIEAPGLMRSNVPGQMGQGVEFDSVTRIREKFLDDQFHNENKSLGSWTVQQDTLEKLEAIINEPSDSGLRSVVDKFWASWSDLSKDPENITGRKIVRENAMAMVDSLNLTSRQLSDLNNDLTENISVKVTQVNSILSTVSDLNAEIKRIEGMGDSANDLRDQRDLLVDDLSKVINIKVQETDTGYNVTMGNTVLVDGDTANPTSVAQITSAVASGELNSGEIHGMIVSRDRYVADYQKQLDTLASTIANGKITVTIPKGAVLPEGTIFNDTVYQGSVENRTLKDDLTVTVNGLNGLHKLGYLNDDPTKKVGDFFTSKDNGAITASNIQLNPTIAADPSNIATSMRTVLNTKTNKEEVITGNNTLAILVSQLKDTKFDFSSTGSAGSVLQSGTINDFLRATVGQLGVQTTEAKRQVDNSKSIVDQVDERRQSVSGVSLDEEMANMIKFQHAYNAAARSMTTFDEMLDKVINGMGVVGR
ncbi:flagellar hook-associated protein FlgK [Paenibacillus sp. UNC451MF]|uniref:flagellar hook-associated protein FlgK n=1 Tax=Paenibacillus sp. UNC451MF TaxID=1449063 RepID=UPI00048C0C09|nr:flagellar hook-associated protein FlgK [Paenibacillus sp. UNC451MF]